MFSFPSLPSSSTGLSGIGTGTGKANFNASTNTNGSGFKLDTGITLNSNLNTSFSPVQSVISNSLYCKGKRGQIFELNTESLQLNLITENSETGIDSSSSSSGFTPSKFLYTVKSAWTRDEKVKRIFCNQLGNFLVIQGSKSNISVLRISSKASVVVSEEIEIEGIPCDLAAVAWHPASPADHHLVVLSRSGRVILYDLLQAKEVNSSEEVEDHSDGETCKMLRLIEVEQEIKLPISRIDSFYSISFLPENNYNNSTWLKFTAFLIKESGDIFALCPFVPRKFRAQRQSHLIPLKSHLTDDSVALKWLDEVLLSGEFVASSSTGDIDWILATCPTSTSFSHLQPRLQGPFLIQPEPMEVHQLTAYDRVVDFITFNHVDIPMLSIAFGSGKVDFLALCSELSPKFQLKGSLIKSQDDSDQLPILALIESVDLKGSNDKTPTRSVDHKIKFLGASGNSDIFVSTDDSVIKINLKIKESFDLEKEKEEEEEEAENDSNDWLLECDSLILVDKLKNHVQCISNNGTIYPGVIKLETNVMPRDIIESKSPNSILENIAKYAFPLGRMEIESGAVQLDGLIENLTKTLAKLKSQTRSSDLSSIKLPKEVNEIGATEFNDHVSEWQETLVSPSIRIGHEIALRSNELVQILQREREILVRAKTLLTAKPDRLGLLLNKISTAKDVNKKLAERSSKILKELSQHCQYDQILSSLLPQISNKLSFSIDAAVPNDYVVVSDEDELVKAQLLLQSEKLLKLKNQLRNL